MTKWIGFLLLACVWTTSEGGNITLTMYPSNTHPETPVTLTCTVTVPIKSAQVRFFSQGYSGVVSRIYQDGDHCYELEAPANYPVHCRNGTHVSGSASKQYQLIIRNATLKDATDWWCDLKDKIRSENVRLVLTSVSVKLTYRYDSSAVILTCIPEVKHGRMDSLLAIGLRKLLSSGRPGALIAQVAPSVQNGQPVLVDTTLVPRATVKGHADVHDIAGSFIVLILDPATCPDTKFYQCEVRYNLTQGESQAHIHRFISGRTTPGPVSMSVSPVHATTLYSVAEVVDAWCTAVLGLPDKKKVWSWQWRLAKGSSKWTAYPYSKRVKDAMDFTGCGRNGSSHLRHVVAEDDNGRMIRCLVDEDERSAKSFTIRTERDVVQLAISHKARILTINCTAAKLQRGVMHHITIELRRDVKSDGKPATFAAAAPSINKGQASLMDPSLRRRATVTGQVHEDDVGVSSVEVVINPASCHDSGDYVCEISYMKSSMKTVTSDGHSNVTLLSTPGLVVMYIMPRKVNDPYFVREPVDFVCTAEVGSRRDDDAPWSWQWRLANGSAEWTPYPYTDRVYDAPLDVVDCGGQGRSVLRHRVSVDDNGRTIRCLVNNDARYSASFTIFVSDK